MSTPGPAPGPASGKPASRFGGPGDAVNDDGTKILPLPRSTGVPITGEEDPNGAVGSGGGPSGGKLIGCSRGDGD